MIYDLLARRDHGGQLQVKKEFGDDEGWVFLNEVGYKVLAAYCISTYNSTMKIVTNSLHLIIEDGTPMV